MISKTVIAYLKDNYPRAVWLSQNRKENQEDRKVQWDLGAVKCQR